MDPPLVDAPLTDIPPAVYLQLLKPNGFLPQHMMQGGLSSATVWKCVNSAGEAACLRRWPSHHPSRSRLAEIHARLQQLTHHGIPFTPRLYCSDRGQTIVDGEQRLWELSSWLPGSADYLINPSRSRLLSAVQGMARIHHVWGQDGGLRTSPTVQDRLHRLAGTQQLLARQRELASRCQSNQERHLVSATCAALGDAGGKLAQSLQQLRQIPLQIHFVQRDIWSDHLLFVGDELGGIIDFGAARVDEPLTDLVRLLSTCEPHRPEEVQWGWQQYLSAREQLGDALPSVGWSWQRFLLLDRTATLLSAVQWMEWLTKDDREFHSPREQLVARWEQFVSRFSQFMT